MAWFDRHAGGKKTPEKELEKSPSPEAFPRAEPVSPAPAQRASADSQPEPVAHKPASSTGAEAGVVAHLYKGSRVSGQLSFQGSARIDGSVDGEIRCQGTLIVGEGAEVKARISGDTVVIRGRVEGNVSAKEKLELAAPARLYGNVNTPRLVIAEGVVFDGDCSMGVTTEKPGVVSSLTEKAAAGQKPKLQAESET
ncbi:MAG TPA: polymer-forming cytoskeletal protein [Candidatus Eisenbacteria bacterium]|nr:polymer-forming cytoskeletal protein [Candidatus Eisenbacteria bacterium]